MTNITRQRRDHRPLRPEPLAVAHIRACFLRALNLGYSTAEASNLANQGIMVDAPEHIPPDPQRTVQVIPAQPPHKTQTQPDPRMTRVTVKGKVERVRSTRRQAPPSLEDSVAATAVDNPPTTHPGARITIQDIPPNWQDLSWPRLRRLANEVSGRQIMSRTDAEAAIEAFLTSASSA